MKTSPKAALRYEKAYERYVSGGYFFKLREFCHQEGIYYQGFIEWSKEKEYNLSDDSLRFEETGIIFKIDLI